MISNKRRLRYVVIDKKKPHNMIVLPIYTLKAKETK